MRCDNGHPPVDMDLCLMFGRPHHHVCSECRKNIIDPSRLSYADREKAMREVPKADRRERVDGMQD